MADVYRAYERELHRMNAMDFDDLLVRAVNVLELFQEVRDHYASTFRHVLVDEYQDTNHAQYRWLQLLAEERRNLMVVGDDAQCLVAGTLVTMADGSTRAIEDVSVGEFVRSGLGGGSFGAARVTRVHRSSRADGVAITLRSGRRLVSTPEHTHFAGRATMDNVRNFRDPAGVRDISIPDVLMSRGHVGDAGSRALTMDVALCDGDFAPFYREDGPGTWPSARLGRDGGALRFTPAAFVRPGMLMFDGHGGYDVVESVERVALDAPVYDLDIARTHNFIANGIVTHNSIYGFRGADIRNILEFEDTFPDAHVVKLEQNYRSTQTILDAANAVIRNNRGQKPKSLWTELGQGDPIKIRELEDEHAEARFVTGEVQRLLDEGVSRAEVAVFYRTNAQSRVLQDTLVRADIPYQVIGGTKFYERAEIKDAIAYLTTLVNPQDAGAFTRIVNSPRRGIGSTSMSRLLAFCQHDRDVDLGRGLRARAGAGTRRRRRSRRSGGSWRRCTCCASAPSRGRPIAELLKEILQETGYLEALEAERTIEAQGRLENLEELVNVAAEYDRRQPRRGCRARAAGADSPRREVWPTSSSRSR